jgi:lipopolysaccharide/colanic/teichoic acid biosynthesis glycosyltransferase
MPVTITEPIHPSSVATAYGLDAAQFAMVELLDRPEPVDLPWQKRTFDAVFAGLALVLAAPLSLVIVLAELLNALVVQEDRGWPFYSETRVSQGRPFQLRKFRILRAPAIRAIRENGLVPKIAENTPGNLTAVGRVLKRTGLDELPQYWSILIGEMSLIGPRPKPSAEYRVEIDAGLYRRSVIRAGLSGPAQLLKGTSRTAGDELLADLRYIEWVRTAGGWRVLGNDLRLLWSTMLLMLKMTGE